MEARATVIGRMLLQQDPLGFKRIYRKYWGRGTGGHTYEFIRIVNETTVLLARPSGDEQNENNPFFSINSSRMARNKALLEKATNQDGKPFTIIKFPVPDSLLTPNVIDAEE
jgi:agmatine deiminase